MASSQNIHKVIKGSSISSETSVDKGHNLSKRFVDFGKQYKQNFYGFVINLKKCVLDPAQEIEFLGLTVDSQTMTLSLQEEKIRKIKDQC